MSKPIRAEFYAALFRCTHCDRPPPEHRWEDGHYWCENDPTKWVRPKAEQDIRSGRFAHGEFVPPPWWAEAMGDA